MEKVLVVLVNYNGKKIIGEALDSLRAQTYHDFDMMVVDNASKDGSIEYLHEHYPEAIVINTGANLGFAEGNNVGFRYAVEKGYKHVALLNTDAKASPNWLADLVQKAEEYPNVGIVSSKLVFWNRFLPLTIQAETHVPKEILRGSEDIRELGILVDSGPHVAGTHYDKVFHGSGWWHPEGDSRWTQHSAHCLTPLPLDYDEWEEVYVTMRGRGIKEGQRIMILVGGQEVGSFTTTSSTHPSSYVIKVPLELAKQHEVDVINNFGSFVDVEGYGHDVAFGVPDTQQLNSYFADAFCGANGLIPVKILLEVGFFDSSYFMYYEDTELSLRMRKHGYRIYISADSTVRHYHSGSSQYNPNIHYYIERNRHITLARYGTVRQAAWIYKNIIGMAAKRAAALFLKVVTLKPGLRQTGLELKLALRWSGYLLMNLLKVARFRKLASHK